MTRGLWIARSLALLGFVDAAYLTATHYSGAVVFCGPEGGCESVLTSTFATLGPVPLAALGVVYYGIASMIAWTQAEAWSRREGVLLVGLTGLAVMASGVLIYLQAAVIHAWCRFCLASATITGLLFVTALALLRVTGSRSPSTDGASTLRE